MQRAIRIPLLWAIVIGGATGFLFRISVPGQAVMTLAFLALGPAAIGWITVIYTDELQPGWRRWIVAPWWAVAVSMALTMATYYEGAICIAFAFPISMLFSSIGGIAAGLWQRTRRKRNAITVSALMLPLMLAPLEAQLPNPIAIRTVRTSIIIEAPATTVWSNIERVSAIQKNEMPQTWTEVIGFPRPVQATLSYQGVGAVRHASFEHGLLFIETITDWQPFQKLAFTIKADTAHIPPTTLDSHVTIGGRYFDVLTGEYDIEQLPGGACRLQLTSRERISTDFNMYAAFWSDAVMRRIQISILGVLKHRCESAGAVRR